CSFSFLFCESATTVIYTLSLHDALPISRGNLPASRGAARSLSDSRRGRLSERGGGAADPRAAPRAAPGRGRGGRGRVPRRSPPRSEEHTSELQSRGHLVCRLLLAKKKQT